jgi:very-short-patch-repair endonuclease
MTSAGLSYPPFDPDCVRATSPMNGGRKAWCGVLSVCEPGKGVRSDTIRSRKFARRLRKSMTRAETILWSHIRRRQLAGFRFRRQHAIGPYIADFACVAHRFIIEVDGATHGTDAEIASDARRTEALERAGWTLHRVWNSDIYENLHGVLDQIDERLGNMKRATEFPPPFMGEVPRRGGGGSSEDDDSRSLNTIDKAPRLQGKEDR